MDTAGYHAEFAGRDRIADRRIVYRRLWWVGSLSGFVAAALNGVLYLSAAALATMPQDVTVPGRGPVTLGAVVSTSVASALIAAGVLALLGRFTRRPVGKFVVLAAVLFVLSCAMPFSLAGAPAAMYAVLLLMHGVAAVVIAGGLIAFATRENWRTS